MFYISYSKTEYDVVACKNIETLFVDLDQKNNCRKYCEEIEEQTCLSKNRKST